MDRNFALPPLRKGIVWGAALLATGLPLVVAAATVAQATGGPDGPDLLRLAQGQAIVALLVLAIVLPLWRREIAFDGRRLRVRATWFNQAAPLADFDFAAARVVDLREHRELRPFLKTFGYFLPGFWAGHFRLRDRRKAFCLVSDPARVLLLPRRDGSQWLLSFEHPKAVLDILRRAAG